MSISNSEISFNTTGITGATTSFGNNRIFGNICAGTFRPSGWHRPITVNNNIDLSIFLSSGKR